MNRILLPLVFLVGFVVLLYLGGVIYIVDETEYAVKTRLGKAVSSIKDDAWRVGWKIPLMDQVFFFPAKVQTYDAAEEHIVTLDKKTLIVDNYFKWKIDSLFLFRNSLQHVSNANSRLASVVHDAVKDVLGNTNLTDIISGEQLKAIQQSQDLANENTKDIGVKIIDIRFKKIRLPESNEGRVYERMKSERNKEAAYYRSQGKEDSVRMVSETDRQAQVILAEAYQQSQEIRGSAEAQAAEIYAQAFNKDPDFYEFWRTLQSYKTTLDTATTLIISPKSELYKYLQGAWKK